MNKDVCSVMKLILCRLRSIVRLGHVTQPWLEDTALRNALNASHVVFNPQCLLSWSLSTSLALVCETATGYANLLAYGRTPRRLLLPNQVGGFEMIW